MDEEQGIYRGEVIAIMEALADVRVDLRRIQYLVEGDDDEEEEDLQDS